MAEITKTDLINEVSSNIQLALRSRDGGEDGGYDIKVSADSSVLYLDNGVTISISWGGDTEQ